MSHLLRLVMVTECVISYNFFSLCEHTKYGIIGYDKPLGGFDFESHNYLSV